MKNLKKLAVVPVVALAGALTVFGAVGCTSNTASNGSGSAAVTATEDETPDGSFSVSDYAFVKVNGNKLTVALDNGADDASWTLDGEGDNLKEVSNDLVDGPAVSVVEDSVDADESDAANHTEYVLSADSKGEDTLTFTATDDESKTVTLTVETDGSGNFVSLEATDVNGNGGSYTK